MHKNDDFQKFSARLRKTDEKRDGQSPSLTLNDSG
jgi:hypothetical protein